MLIVLRDGAIPLVRYFSFYYLTGLNLSNPIIGKTHVLGIIVVEARKVNLIKKKKFRKLHLEFYLSIHQHKTIFTAKSAETESINFIYFRC